MDFELISPFKPKGGQPEAIRKLAGGYRKHARQTLLGITGCGKTFIIANVIAKVNRPTLVLAHNKTLAAQLYAELKLLFPKNRVEYFVSYYDYYQPESYIPQKDLYIEKDAQRNDELERLRLRATAALASRDDVVIVSSISCIYGLGDPDDFRRMAVPLKVGAPIGRHGIVSALVAMQYDRNDTALDHGRFRVRGNTIDVIPGYDKDVVRVELDGEKIRSICVLDSVSLKKITELKEIRIFPAKHFVIPEEKVQAALQSIKAELQEWLPSLGPLEQERLRRRTKYDLEMIDQLGYCTGIENYSRHFEGRAPGTPPSCLLDFFPDDFLMVIDESHQTIPQAHAMYHGDYARKKNLVEFGFRLPSAFDNRPLKFEEFEKYLNHVIFVSATPADYERNSSGQIAECIVRPTGLLDPIVEVRPTKDQIDDLIDEAKRVIKRGSRVLVTTLTKKMAENLTDYLAQAGVKVRYLHSEIETIERTEIIRQLRLGEFDVLVGINLLREGLDIPEVALVAILDADKESFLRDARSLIQTIGRAARNADGRVIMYADRMTRSMREAVGITQRRRAAQEAFNKEQGITPKTIIKAVEEAKVKIRTIKHMAKSDVPKRIAQLEAEMTIAAEKLDFEKAIALRDEIDALKRDAGL